jgi:hypothetical protein
MTYPDAHQQVIDRGIKTYKRALYCALYAQEILTEEEIKIMEALAQDPTIQELHAIWVSKKEI